ncbi:metalloregulator ArsR/SmtB family transcription factor [Candidatus Villigracilis affinis]|jgi:DNA-binding transcriptional ArsR family regulator|uniref:ArsR/SmtB family transcription factor n=1 Tax=Candidatus Villigracilis affinis TaxID=3140682 RepID=UPI001D4D8887|nr:helix-turn-helix transcriptional regulator [Anaerolineales bacterium]
MLITSTTSSIDLQAKLFRGFADPSRLGILDALRNGPLTVSEIVEATSLSQPNVSNHLGCLRDCGLVAAEQQGRYVTYHLSDDRVGELIALAESLLADVARGVYECTRYNIKVSKNG